MRTKIALVLCVLIGAADCFCQSAQVTTNALFRTFMIETTKGRGTVFSIDVDNREYWITAKHMLTGIKYGPAGTFTTRSVQANILSQKGTGQNGQDQQWETVQFQTIDPGKDIDIVILVPDHLLLDFPRDFNLRADNIHLPMGGDCTFLGFPYGGGWAMNWEPVKAWLWVPYIKHCTTSGQHFGDGPAFYVLDGINNEGFSGGPVLYGTGLDQRVFAVISGFHQEPLEVMPAPEPGQAQTKSVPPPPLLPGQSSSNSLPNQQSEQQPHEIVEANSGFIVAFNLQPAIDAIRANPIGPLRPESSTTDKK